MLSRNTLRVVVTLALLPLVAAILGLNGLAVHGLARSPVSIESAPQGEPRQPPSGVPKPDAAHARQPGQSEDEKAIRAVDDAFVRDYNKADSKGLASRFTEDAEVVEAEGDRYQGRDLIERRFAETFAASPGLRIALEIGAIRFLNPDAAKEEGRTLVTPAKGLPVSRPYTVLFVRRDGRWLMSSVREEPDLLVRLHDRLKDLEWIIG